MTGGRDLDSEAERRGDIYRRLGVEPIVNGRSTFTILGGSLMPPVVLDAMRDAAASFVDLVELQAAVGRRIAERTRNEAAFVSGGAAAGLFLAAAAAMLRDTDDGLLRVGDDRDVPRDFVIHRGHRIPYELAIGLAGGSLVAIGSATGTLPEELDRALGTDTAAVIYVPKSDLAAQVLPLDTVVAAAGRHGVPVIVDAAAQLPPMENLWRFTEAGADLVVFSGGKALCGPASTGLVLGSRRFVERVAINAAPLQRLGRPMKVGKEDLIGILAAVEWYVSLDHDAEMRRYEAAVAHIVEWGRGRGDVAVTRIPYGEAGQPTPRALVRVLAGSAARDALHEALLAAPPRVDLLAHAADGLSVAPETLLPGEERIVTERLTALLDEA